MRDMEKDGFGGGGGHLGSCGQSVSKTGIKEWLESCRPRMSAAAETTPHILQVATPGHFVQGMVPFLALLKALFTFFCITFL
jgi:hypothetical protein